MTKLRNKEYGGCSIHNVDGEASGVKTCKTEKKCSMHCIIYMIDHTFFYLMSIYSFPAVLGFQNFMANLCKIIWFIIGFVNCKSICNSKLNLQVDICGNKPHCDILYDEEERIFYQKNCACRHFVKNDRLIRYEQVLATVEDIENTSSGQSYAISYESTL